MSPSPTLRTCSGPYKRTNLLTRVGIRGWEYECLVRPSNIHTDRLQSSWRNFEMGMAPQNYVFFVFCKTPGCDTGVTPLLPGGYTVVWLFAKGHLAFCKNTNPYTPQ